MTTWPHVAIGVITYSRPREIRLTLSALAQHVRYPGRVTVVIADDCTPGSYLIDLHQWWMQSSSPNVLDWGFRPISTERNGGWGRNANHLLKYVFDEIKASYLFFIEDDYVLTRPLDLASGIALMQQEPGLGMLRYRATAGTPVRYQQHETDIRGWLPDYREYRAYVNGKLTWLELLPGSPTLWLYSNGPHLKSRVFHEIYGAYPEGLKLGETEEYFAHMVKEKINSHPNTPKIGVLPEWIYMHFDHVGVSFQHTELDR